ncbi:retropepsin-like aspartic protease [Treponema sp. R80B11-R83G3]
MSKVKHFAFKQDNQSLCFRLLTEAHIFNISTDSAKKGIKITALWDTGATGSAITPNLAQKMNLIPINRVKVTGVNNTSIVDVAKVSIGLPNRVMVDEVNVMICNLNQGFDLIIGMDIILLGDFSISNGGGKTLFSFAIPPFEKKTDHYEKAIALNNRNKV